MLIFCGAWPDMNLEKKRMDALILKKPSNWVFLSFVLPSRRNVHHSGRKIDNLKILQIAGVISGP
jgi:hypothetical protein